MHALYNITVLNCIIIVGLSMVSLITYLFLNYRYQECIEAANEDMSTNIVKQKTVDNIFDVLCTGMDQVIYLC